jgi:hypothetical protein
LSLKIKVDDLIVVWPQNHWDGFLRFGLKTGGDDFLQFGSQNQQLQFGDLGLKITATVSWFGPQNQAGFDFGCGTKPMEGGRRGTRIEIW